MPEFSAACANAMLNLFETTVGTDAVMKIRTGARPTHVADADSGTVLATLTLPTDWMAAASGGSKAKLGTWADGSADATGTAAHYRIYASDGTTCHQQGSVGTSGTDIVVDSVAFVASQAFSISAFTLTISI